MSVPAIVRGGSSFPCGTWRVPWVSRYLPYAKVSPFPSNTEANAFPPINRVHTARVPFRLMRHAHAAPSPLSSPALPLAVPAAVCISSPSRLQTEPGKVRFGGFQVRRIRFCPRIDVICHSTRGIDIPAKQGCLYYISVKCGRFRVV